MEFAAQIPPLMKLKKGASKYLLKKAAEYYVPRKVIYRRKQGFTVPIGKWLREDLKHVLGPLILSKQAKARGLFDYDYVRHMISEHLEGRENHDDQLWSLLWLELWFRMFVDKELQCSDILKF